MRYEHGNIKFVLTVASQGSDVTEGGTKLRLNEGNSSHKNDTKCIYLATAVTECEIFKRVNRRKSLSDSV